MNNQIILYDNQFVDSLIFSSSALTETEQSSFNSNDTLSWSDFANAKILCNFDNSLTSSYFSGITGEITSYEISKIKNNDSFYTKVATLQESELKTDPDDEDYYYITDYNTNNNNQYSYYISPMTNTAVQTTLTGKIITDWDVFTLTPIIKNSDNSFSVVQDENGNPVIWSFLLNCSENELTLNQDKTIFSTFAEKPKISIGELNYITSSFSCLLGQTLYNGQYYESNVLLEKWNDMLKNQSLFLFKNPKGDTMIVSIDAGSSRQYMNEVANYYINNINDVNEITNRPTTISFSYTEIQDTANVQIHS